MNILHKLEDIEDRKIFFFDLDGTLINTSTGKTFPEDVTDFRINKKVLDVLRRINSMEYLFIVSNQAGIPQHQTKEDFEAKFSGILEFIKTYINVGRSSSKKVKVGGYYCTAKGFNSKNRKPNTGMLERCVKGLDYPKESMVMCGDATGIHNETRDDFSDSDFRTARNFKIDYIDIDDIVSM